MQSKIIAELRHQEAVTRFGEVWQPKLDKQDHLVAELLLKFCEPGGSVKPLAKRPTLPARPCAIRYGPLSVALATNARRLSAASPRKPA